MQEKYEKKNFVTPNLTQPQPALAAWLLRSRRAIFSPEFVFAPIYMPQNYQRNA